MKGCVKVIHNNGRKQSKKKKINTINLIILQIRQASWLSVSEILDLLVALQELYP